MRRWIVKFFCHFSDRISHTCVCAKIYCSFRDILKVIVSVCYSNIMYWHQHVTCLCTSFSFYRILVFSISFFLHALAECQQNPPKVNDENDNRFFIYVDRISSICHAIRSRTHYDELLSLCQNVEYCLCRCERLANQKKKMLKLACMPNCSQVFSSLLRVLGSDHRMWLKRGVGTIFNLFHLAFLIANGHMT